LQGKYLATMQLLIMLVCIPPPHSCTVHSDVIQSFISPTNAQLVLEILLAHIRTPRITN